MTLEMNDPRLRWIEAAASYEPSSAAGTERPSANERRRGGWGPGRRPAASPRRTPEIPWKKSRPATGSEETTRHAANGLAGEATTPTDAQSSATAGPRQDVPPVPVDPEATRVSPPRLLFTGAHGGAGTTTWARVFDAPEATSEQAAWLATRRTWSLVVVARASVAGIDAAKKFLAANRDHVAYVLLVPATPARPHKAIRQEIKVLAGATTVVEAPWVPDLLLRLPSAVRPEDVPERDLARLRAELPTLQGDAQ